VDLAIYGLPGARGESASPLIASTCYGSAQVPLPPPRM
jgi:hypothetical protein